MNYEEMKKEELVKILKEHAAKTSYFNDWQESARQNMVKLEKIDSLEREIAKLHEEADKKRRSMKARMLRLADMRERQEEAIQRLFALYSTVLLEDKWNNRIDWKNDVLEEIQHLIRQLS